MRNIIVAVIVLLSGCATVTPQAAARRVATGRLRSCVATVGKHVASPWDRAECARAAEAYCVSKGLEKTCASDSMWAGF